ncbi:MAG: HD domain-containing phosphohydrolase [Candidatus Omnitrophota bacterium]
MMPESNSPIKAQSEKTLNLASLEEISKVLGSSLNLNKLYNVVLDTMLRQTRADSGSLMIYDEANTELHIKASQGIKAQIAQHARIKLGEGIAGLVAQQNQPLLLNDATIPLIKKSAARRRNVKSSLSIPLSFANKLIGVVNLNRIPGSVEFTKNDLNIISKFARESSIAIHNAKLYVAAEEKIQQLFRFNVISCALNSVLDQDAIINVLGDCIRDLFSFDIFTLMLFEDENYFLFIGSSSAILDKTKHALKKNLLLVASSARREVIQSNKIFIISKKIKGIKRSKKRIHPADLKSNKNAPLVSKGNMFGMLSLYSTNPDHFDEKDQQALSTLANQASVALENANLYKNLRKTYISTIKALAQAIEEKDIYTRGHSELVSYYAVAMAQALKLPAKMVEGIQIAGILHDIGKIGIPEKILSKPSQLTTAEYKIIKKHPLIGKRILDPVNFFWGETAGWLLKRRSQNKILSKHLNKNLVKKIESPLSMTLNILESTDLSDEIKTTIYHHHERYGGGGYPDGIKENAIPVGSRILAVADTFEAMTADRPYRKAFRVKVALKLLKDCAPAQLDPAIVNLFINLVKRKWIVVK